MLLKEILISFAALTSGRKRLALTGYARITASQSKNGKGAFGRLFLL
jgi:hypothetical protein